MKILGIDPGTATTGFGIIKVDGNNIETIGWGLIETDKEDLPGDRLVKIFNLMKKIVEDNTPDIIAIEKLFFSNNAKTAMRVGQAQGVMIYCGAMLGLNVIEYAPGTIKKMITGSGRSDKKAVQQHIRKILGNQVKSKAHKRTHFDNAADALAVALCHAIKEYGLVI
jgi:crossover junction endodeoxyribonuclease RuvC